MANSSSRYLPSRNTQYDYGKSLTRHLLTGDQLKLRRIDNAGQRTALSGRLIERLWFRSPAGAIPSKLHLGGHRRKVHSWWDVSFNRAVYFMPGPSNCSAYRQASWLWNVQASVPKTAHQR